MIFISLLPNVEIGRNDYRETHPTLSCGPSEPVPVEENQKENCLINDEQGIESQDQE